jgi:hypothetical protein
VSEKVFAILRFNRMSQREKESLSSSLFRQATKKYLPETGDILKGNIL